MVSLHPIAVFCIHRSMASSFVNSLIIISIQNSPGYPLIPEIYFFYLCYLSFELHVHMIIAVFSLKSQKCSCQSALFPVYWILSFLGFGAERVQKSTSNLVNISAWCLLLIFRVWGLYNARNTWNEVWNIVYITYK